MDVWLDLDHKFKKLPVNNFTTELLFSTPWKAIEWMSIPFLKINIIVHTTFTKGFLVHAPNICLKGLPACWPSKLPKNQNDLPDENDPINLDNRKIKRTSQMESNS